MDKLGAVANRTLAAAGPRYSPGLDPDAPNLEIRPLQQAASALTLGAGFRARAKDLAGSVRAAYDRDHYLADRLFAQRRLNLHRLADDLELVATSHSAREVRENVLGLRRCLKAVRQRVEAAESEAYEGLRALDAGEPTPDPDEAKRVRPQERERFQARLSVLRRLTETLEVIGGFADGREGTLLTERNSILLLGEWGTGKTHFLCDFALQSLGDGAPAVVVLASSLRTDRGPLDAIAESTGLATTGAELVQILEVAAQEASRRAVILVDAINESDREAWRRQLAGLVRQVSKAEHLGLVVSCRTPFDSSAVSESARNRMVQLTHPGFEDQEFDAQLEFFRHYDLPALHVPLLTAEFSRPLFLRLMCEGMRELSKRSQRNKLRDIASGQKSMTYVLEHFVKRVGAEVEAEHNLPSNACWLIMKGEPRKGRSGLAGVLASNRREWMSLDEVVQEVRAFASLTEEAAMSAITSMKAAGLVVEHSRYTDGRYVDVFMLPYQRFSDHLVARHLLDEHLDPSSEDKLRRCFYANKRLGAVFLPNRWGNEFAEAGVASALMIEFPERVKRLAQAGTAPAELLGYLPKQRRLLHPFVDTFLEGLYWRPNSGFTSETERLVTLLLDRREPDIRTRTYEVVVGLAARADHPLGVDWLHARLGAMTLPDRDVEWSEFLRSVESDSNVQRLLAWVEREDRAKVNGDTAERVLRILALLLTTTDRQLRDRATRAMVSLGEAHPRILFELVPELLPFNDPYVPERVLAAAYGVCMRRSALEASKSAFADSLAIVAGRLLDLLLRPGAPRATWHALTRGYAVGMLQVLLQLRPRALTRSDRELLALAPGQAPSPFRSVSRIRKEDVADPEHAIHMDFGNYTMGRLVDDRGNYDFKHREYAGVRRQIADRMRRLGYSTERFNDLDIQIVRNMERRRNSHKVDRYGKKYSWIAFFEMYGMRCAMGKIDDHPLRYPRPSDSDVDPSFPDAIPKWDPPRRNIFDSSAVEIHKWLVSGEVPEYESLLRVSEVDGHAGDWVLLDASIHEGVDDGRELRGWVTSVFVPERSVFRLRAEVVAGRDLSDHGFPDLGADYYTYHGEIPWSLAYGSDVRTTRGLPKRVSDRAFDYFDRRWKRGIPVEDSCRRWAWESYHSELNQVDSVVFPAPPIAVALKLRVAGGSSDMISERGKVATIYRETPGPGFGSHFLYMRSDLVEKYAAIRGLRLVQAVAGERSISYRTIERGVRESVSEILRADLNRFGVVVGLDDGRVVNRSN
jgi:hypothetical protein